MPIQYSFVVPAYNEEENAPVLYTKIVQLMANIADDWELIYVNDGSRDNTLAILRDLAQKDKRVRYIDLSRNFGHQAALTAGLDASTGQAVISLDCDLQDPPELITEMIQKWQQGYDIVYARRRKRQDNFLKKYTAIWYYRLLDRFAEIKMPRNVGDFRLVDRKVQDYLTQMKEKAIYLRGMVAWLGFKTTYVEFDRPEREHGVPGYTWEKSIRLAMDGLLSFSLFPLKLGFVLGGFTIFIGFLFLTYMVFDTLANNAEYELIKWLSVAIFMAMGLQFIFMWLLGEYVGRIYEDTKRRPIYVINEKVNFEINSNTLENDSENQ